MVALLAGAGGGFGVQRYLSEHEMEEFQHDGLKVQVPREWSKYIGKSTWRPVGAGADQPALRVSQAEGVDYTPGVFVGWTTTSVQENVRPGKDFGCKTDTDTTKDTIPAMRTSRGCPGGTALLQLYFSSPREDQFVYAQVLVPEDELDRGNEIAGSIGGS